MESFERLEREYVVSVDSEIIPNDDDTTFTVQEFINWINHDLGWNEEIFKEGVECTMLKPGVRGWQKGKVRVTLEFCPDEPESPLDDMRKMINQKSQQENS